MTLTVYLDDKRKLILPFQFKSKSQGLYLTKCRSGHANMCQGSMTVLCVKTRNWSYSSTCLSGANEGAVSFNDAL